jgi:hypothetical protein
MTSESMQPAQPVEPGQPAVAPAVEPGTEAFQPAAPEPGPFEVPPQPVAIAKPRGRGAASWINVALGLALAVAIGGVAFAAGRMTAPAAAAAGGPNGGPNGGRFFGNGYFPGGGAFPGDRNGQGGPGGRTFGGASIQGTVTAVTADSITIKTASGQEITIALDSTTTYHQQTSATASDVKTGGTVIVRLGFDGNGSGSETPTGPTANDVTVVP